MLAGEYGLPAAVVPEPGNVYPVSGLYRNDGSLTPLWTVDWYAFEVRLSRDGRHLVRFGPRPSHARMLAVAFYEEGRLLKAYTIEELVSNLEALPRSVSHFRWRAGADVDDRRQILRLRTLSGDTHLFDLTTGERLASLTSHSQGIAGRITRHDGSTERVTALRVCWAETIMIGTAARLDQGALKLERSDAVRLEDVSRMRRVHEPATDRLVFRLWLDDAGQRLFDFTAHEQTLCGQTEDGRMTRIGLDEVARFER